jgi:hypothetical protein
MVIKYYIEYLKSLQVWQNKLQHLSVASAVDSQPLTLQRKQNTNSFIIFLVTHFAYSL